MKNLKGTPFEGSFLDVALREDLRGDELFDKQTEFTDNEDQSVVGSDGRLIHDRRHWGVTWDEESIYGFFDDLVDVVVESYRRDLPVLTLLKEVAEKGDPFPELREQAQWVVDHVDEWGMRASYSRSVRERLDPNAPFLEGPNAPGNSLAHLHDWPFDWPFTDAPETTANVSETFIAGTRTEVSVFSHDVNGKWRAYDESRDPDSMTVACLGCLVQKFPELAGLSDLPLGWEARRSAGKWERYKSPSEL